MNISILAKLPCELRLEIYRFALCQPNPIDIGMREPDKSLHLLSSPHPHNKSLHLLALSSTCGEIRIDTLPIFFSQNHFKIRFLSSLRANPNIHGFTYQDFTLGLASIQNWLHHILPNDGRGLRTVTIDLGYEPQIPRTVLWIPHLWVDTHLAFSLKTLKTLFEAFGVVPNLLVTFGMPRAAGRELGCRTFEIEVNFRASGPERVWEEFHGKTGDVQGLDNVERNYYGAAWAPLRRVMEELEGDGEWKWGG